MLVLVVACASAPQAIIGTDGRAVSAFDIPGASTIDVFVATTREPDDDTKIFYSGDRNDSVGYAKVTVSIPPNHKPGQIERPRTQVPNPNTEFAILNPKNIPTSQEFVTDINRSLEKHPSSERDVLIFVHGYNTDLTSAILRTAQFAHDVNYPGVPVLFSWASSGRTFDYVYDLNSALHARDALLRTGEVLSQTNADGFNVLAHSMGTLLTVEAMRQAALVSRGRRPENFRVKGIALAAPDIDIDLFRKQIEVIPTGDIPIYILTSTDDKALALSSRIAGGRTRVGAAEATQLADLGIIIVDLSELEDRDSVSHTKFANSPEAIRALAAGLRAGNSLETQSDRGFRISDLVGGGSFRILNEGQRLVVE